MDAGSREQLLPIVASGDPCASSGMARRPRSGSIVLAPSHRIEDDSPMGLRIVAVITLAAGCASASYRYSRTTSASAPAKAASCEFDVLTTRPSQPYDELGVLERWYKAGFGGASFPSDVTAFREAIRGPVCQAGADAVLAEVDAQGSYVRGTALRYRTP